jgi:hypothetical protein
MFCQCWCGEVFEFEMDEQIVICPHCLCYHDDLPPENAESPDPFQDPGS